MSKKSEQIAKLGTQVELPYELPEPLAEATLLEQGLYAVLLRDLTQKRAVAAIGALEKRYDDWNEARVAQAQELAATFAPGGKAPLASRLRSSLPAARGAKEYLQLVFQHTHGLDLEGMREDLDGMIKVLGASDALGAALTTFIGWAAAGGTDQLPVGLHHVRVLDRMGLLPRTTSAKKARAALEPLLPKGRELETLVKVGFVADRWCDSRRPICWECPLVDSCPYGKKARADWQAQQKRQELQRKKEEARRKAEEERERKRQEREAARERKRAEERARKAERERQKKEKAAAASKKKAEAIRQAAARKKAEAKKKVSAKKKATKKAAKKPAARKPAAKKKTTKAGAKKKTVRKAAAKRKTTARKATGKKSSRRSTTRRR